MRAFRMIATAVAIAALAQARTFAQEVEIQGPWTYSRETAPDDMVEMATTPALQDRDVSLLLACGGNGRLSVALMHADYFPFELDESSSVQLQSARLSVTSAVAERAQTAQIVFDPTLVRHIMALLAVDQELSLSVAARDGVVHRYTFALQPNNVVLASLRERCSGD